MIESKLVLPTALCFGAIGLLAGIYTCLENPDAQGGLLNVILWPLIGFGGGYAGAYILSEKVLSAEVIDKQKFQ